ncbi:MAG: hypothetical protein KDK00_01965 [Rhodobacteraceae bacterium]|nr:hypothetical protein [Paracoccaceae bacterium]
MRLADIDANGVILNVIECDPSAVPDWAAGLVDIGAAGGPGWTWDGTTVAPPPDPAPDRTTMTLSFAQLLIGLVAEGWITEAEGDAWLAGTLPAGVLALIATMPQAAQFAARARAIKPSYIVRLDPLVIALAQAQGKSDAELDTFFLTYAQV